MTELPVIAPARPAPDTALHVLVIGGGASGVLMAAQLLRQDPRARVTIVEAANMLGCGLAYSTRDPDHLLNTRADNMSAWPDDPGHFARWLEGRTDGGDGVFVSRATYGAYLGGLLDPWRAGGRLACLRHRCLRVEEGAAGVAAHLDDGQVIRGHLAVLATGICVPPPDLRGIVTGGWEDPGPIDPDARVIIVGSGLSMVDQVLSLMKAGHRGQIVSISRRGLLPRPHAPGRPLTLRAEDIPLGAPVSRLLHWLRGLARQAEAGGGTWRDAVDGLRPHLAAVWQALPQAERARFLRHAVTWWEVHRHRIPPASAERIGAALASGQLAVRRGSFLRGGRGADGGIRALVRLRGHADPVALGAGRIIDCRGIRHDPARNAGPPVADLLARGRVRVDPLRLGLEVTADCRLVDAGGRASARILAIGPVSRAAFWEITAIPDIRGQTARLAAGILTGA
ncbi:FAD/NAD(P)-binding protein [Ruixingdingia sedimenti]|uniref:FAD/NAD(P)-binding protein n=1 Tax=Ruixingdingia sedimenti TaxID=3073604 RepID=A0ABU1F2Y1_9RHOB|nr:FAD/NAD(P)-binding protein [Xinfangfangia sp. LG-4]MDR5651216.1 FAD/NAD(P)-binding protein [Xinfangfangia sp. LG-4]